MSVFIASWTKLHHYLVLGSWGLHCEWRR